MKEIQQDIYRYDGELRSDRTPLVLVHPWYDEDTGNEFKVYKEPLGPFSFLSFRRRDYLKNLRRLLRKSSDRNIFLFEEAEEAEKSSERVYDLTGDTKGIYIIKTRLGNPVPLTSTWQDVIGYIGKFSRDSEVDVAGGYVNEYLTGDYYGCAGTTYEKFKARGIKPSFVKGCCFC